LVIRKEPFIVDFFDKNERRLRGDFILKKRNGIDI